MSEVSIRKAEVKDIPHILEITSRREFRATSSENDKHDKEDLTEWITSENDLLMVAECDGTVAGVILCIKMARKWFMIETFYVQPESRGRGIGSRLLSTAEDVMGSRGSVYAFVLVDKDDQALVHTVKKDGFEAGRSYVWCNKWIGTRSYGV